MSTENSTNSVTSNIRQSTIESLVSAGDEMARRQFQSVLLVWLDNNSDNCQDTINQLSYVISEIHTFIDGEKGVQFIKETENIKVCVIISGTLGPDIVPRVHDMPQVDSILIFCGNANLHEEWVKNWSKIQGVFTEMNLVCEALQVISKQCERDAMPISFVATNDGVLDKKLNQLEPSFMYTGILKKIILTIQFEPIHVDEYIEHCYVQFAQKPEDLKVIKELKEDYRPEKCIQWYSRECFLYPMLNLGLRTMNCDIIIKMGFFINDLHRQIEQLNAEQYSDQLSRKPFTVYRGQGLPISSFEQIQKIRGGLMSFNNFLSTSTNRDVSMPFARSALTKPDSVGVLFVMKIDPEVSTTPFASIKNFSYFEGEDEILFSMQSIFRIESVETMDGNARLFQVNLTLTNDNDDDLRQLTNRIEEETHPEKEKWYRLGAVLVKMAQYKKAEDIFRTLLDQTDQESEQHSIYHYIGWVKHVQGKYDEAREFYEKAVKIREKIFPPNDRNLASSYNNIGLMYMEMSQYPEALASFEKCLAVQQQLLPSDHSNLAVSYNNIGLVHSKMGDYERALFYYEKTLTIQQGSLPSNHPDLGNSHSNIGLVFMNKGDYPQSLSNHEKGLAIRQHSLPEDHPDLAESFNNIGLLYMKMKEYSNVLGYLEKALTIRQQISHSTPLELGESYHSIGLFYKDMEDYTKALSYFEKGLSIRQQSLPSRHPDLALSYGHIGHLYFLEGEHTKALSFYQNAVNIAQQSLPPSHPHLQWYLQNLDDLKKTISIT